MAGKKQIVNSIKDKLQALPSKPGVYLFKDAKDEVIYVGKALRLSSRVRSYFRDDPKATPKTKVLVKNIADMEYIVTSSEVEALVLENNLIKKYRPKYNIRLRDDKNYQYLKITNEDFPQVILVRRMLKDGARYFGPYTSSAAIKDALRLVQKVFAYKKCEHEFFEVPDAGNQNPGKARNPRGIRPCVQYQMGRCIGVCLPEISKQEHDEIISLVIKFFDGRANEIVETLEMQMYQAAEAQQFEKAGKLRDQIHEMRTIFEKQRAVMTDQGDRDVLGLAVRKTRACVQLFKVRRGLLLGREEFTLDCAADCDGQEVIQRVLADYYERANEIPREILLPIEIEDRSALVAWLVELKTKSEKRKAGVEIFVPQRGEKRKLLALVNENAKQRLDELMGEWMTKEQRKSAALKDIKDALQLVRKPERIEAYDISHLGGEGTVGSMVVMMNGEEKKSDYRKFKIRTIEGGDDYEALREMIRRRFSRLKAWETTGKGLSLRQPSQKDMKFIEEIIQKEKLDSEDMKKEQFVVLKDAKKIVGFGRVKQYASGPSFVKATADRQMPVTSGQVPDAGGQKVKQKTPEFSKGDEHSATYELASLWIDPVYRGQKLSYMLLGELIKRCPDSVVYGVTFPHLAEYFEGFGFVKVKKVPEVFRDKIKRICPSICKDPAVIRFDKILRKKEDLSFKTIPDLVLIDGGKGQLSAALQALREVGLVQNSILRVTSGQEFKTQSSKNKAKGKAGAKGLRQKAKGMPWQGFAFPVIGLAKEREQVYVPWQKEPIDLASDSLGSLLLQRIRDEAHRFAISYQKNVRSKQMFE